MALITALLIGGFIIAVTDVDILKLWGNDPGEAFSRTFDSVSGAYVALFEGSFGSVNALSETLFAATPLILAGLAVAVGFQAGLFNIGAEGQIVIGGMTALYVGFTVDAPGIVLIPLALIGAILGGAVWGGIAGLLRAKTGAHEVITTIMLNFIGAVPRPVAAQVERCSSRPADPTRSRSRSTPAPSFPASVRVRLPGHDRLPDRSRRRRRSFTG